MTVFDVELTFKAGPVLALQIQEGRDTLQRHDGLLRLVIRHSDTEEEEVVCQQADLAFSRITKRQLTADATTHLDDPQTKVSGDLPDVR